MIAVFQVGQKEMHSIEVFSYFFSGKDIIKVDGKEIINKRSFRFTDKMKFEVDNEEKHIIEIKYNALTFKSMAYVDNKLLVGCLFPQIAGYNAFILAMIALLFAIAK